ncbi:uncharacterized protein LOC132635874 isoform X3 [Lycium barbarum]|uniref:uncharacterized protein LOC132635874 isoform X3 n=1 Tax=Lycium barbarum TaxID=112863 RepID=UPI00293F0D26|nr:uncharacterized protein LOC132635874 isoform X3 [Lycium barbarum]
MGEEKIVRHLCRHQLFILEILLKVHVNMKRQKKSEERRGVKMFQASKLERSTLLGGYRGRVVGIYVGSCNYKIKNSKSILSLKKVQSKIEVQKVFILLVVV